jgi:hypothetical protein
LQMNAEGQPRWIHEKELRPLLSAHSLRILDDYLRYRSRQNAKTGALLSENSLQLVPSGRY